jgi:hypothetical protein
VEWFTVDRAFCVTDWLSIMGRRRMVMATTTKPMLKRMPNWIFLFRVNIARYVVAVG